MKTVYVLLAVLYLHCIIFYKVYHWLPLAELRRRARADSRRYAVIYKAVAFQPSLDVLIWLLGTAAGATLFIWSARTNWWLAVIAMAVTAWMAVWARFSSEGWAGGLVGLFAPVDIWTLSILQPVLGPVARLLPPGRRIHIRTGLYEKRDVLEFIKQQNEQSDNRVPELDLLIAFNALQFGDKQVSQIMTPRRQVKMVSGGESIGPILTDELHKTGFSRFPVVKDSTKAATPKIIGTLYLNDLIGYEGSGKIKDLADHDVYFINEDSDLRQALNAFLKTHHHLLIVVNSFEEMVGVLSLEDVLEQIIGAQIVDEFDNYESLRAVAAQDAKKDHKDHAKTHPEPNPPEPKNKE